jgi:Cu2+-exporting ATPase
MTGAGGPAARDRDGRAAAVAAAAAPGAEGCRHCGLPVAAGDRFCCPGCAGAHALVHDLGLAAYYRRRVLDPSVRPLRPEADDGAAADLAVYSEAGGDGTRQASLVIEGLHCAACVWLIESVLARTPGVVEARVNMTSRRLALRWRGDADPAAVVGPVLRLGYRLVPFDPRALAGAEAVREKALLRAMAVAGFAFANVMLLSVAVWAGHDQGMGWATRTLMHWLSALIALPAIAYAGRPFFASALAALRRGRTNMDVPISLGVTLAAGMSLWQTVAGAEHAYFDSAIGLLFFLLVGSYLDSRARGRARSAAEQLLTLSVRQVTELLPSGETRPTVPARLAPGALVLAAAGERIAVDGQVVAGASTVDTGLIDGETLPKPVEPGSRVFAGTVNLSAPLRIVVGAVGEATLLAEITRLVEAAESHKGRYVILADRIARYYTPFVHVAALATFLGWWGLAGLAWPEALLIAVAVLIITCPCALALAVPVVQVIAVGRLLRRGVLVKSGTALERLAACDTVCFDKTGTLTEGRPVLADRQAADGSPVTNADLRLAASLAATSRHPLARALVRAAAAAGVAVQPAPDVIEHPGLGLGRDLGGGRVLRLGSRRFVGLGALPSATVAGPELWLAEPGKRPVAFRFADQPRSDARDVIDRLDRLGVMMALLSGDQPPAVAAVAKAVGIDDWQAGLTPGDKVTAIRRLGSEGRRVLMVGDGLNDAPALAAAFASMSPATAVDISQTAADVVFQGERLAPVVETLGVAAAAGRLARQNLALAFAYNAVTVPLAVAGLVTPLVAAIAMSSSSLLVTANALRLGRMRL